MNAMTIGASGAFEWKSVSEPVLGGDFDTLVEVRACALNRADVMQRAGTYAPPGSAMNFSDSKMLACIPLFRAVLI
jgi:NADPH:quinone reductase-like Zn-dependent oxidoreductase